MTLNTRPFWDVDVGGSGLVSLSTPIPAARTEAGVALIECYGLAGGVSTQVLDTVYGFYTPGEHPERVVGGLLVAGRCLSATHDAHAWARSAAMGHVACTAAALRVRWDTSPRSLGPDTQRSTLTANGAFL